VSRCALLVDFEGISIDGGRLSSRKGALVACLIPGVAHSHRPGFSTSCLSPLHASHPNTLAHIHNVLHLLHDSQPSISDVHFALPVPFPRPSGPATSMTWLERCLRLSLPPGLVRHALAWYWAALLPCACLEDPGGDWMRFSLLFFSTSYHFISYATDSYPCSARKYKVRALVDSARTTQLCGECLGRT
jgi:hypothetical protein